MRYRSTCIGIASALIFILSGFPTRAADRDTAACDNTVAWETRVAGCTRLLGRKGWSSRILGQIYLQRGQGYMHLSKYDLGLPDFEKAAELIPNSPDVYSERGNARIGVGRVEEGIEDATRAIQMNPKSPYAFNTRGSGYNKIRDFDRSIADLKQALRLNPRFAIAHVNLSDAYRGLGQSDLAIQAADTAIQIDAGLYAAYFSRGSAYAAAGKYDLALTDFGRAIKLQPKEPEAYGNRALVWAALDDPDHQLADLDETIRLNPTLANPFSNRCQVLAGKRDFDGALADCNKAISLDPKQSVYFGTRSAVYFKKGEIDQALSDINRAIRLEPDNAGHYASRGDIWRSKEDLSSALADLDRSIKLNPSIAGTYAVRGQVYETRGEIDLARRDYEKAVALPATISVVGNTTNYFQNSHREQETARTRLALLKESVSDPAKPAPQSVPRPDMGRRAALVIGNGGYVGVPKLENPTNDAKLIAESLRSIGFEVSDGIDLNREGMKRTIGDFLKNVVTTRMAIVFYAGHGMQIDGKNYLVPIDVDLTKDTASLIAEMTDLDFILSGLDDKIRTSIIILDACRDNPLAAGPDQPGSGRSIRVRSGLATPSGLGSGATLGAGTLIAFATAPGQVASDGEGKNSPFSSALGRHITTPGLEVQQMLTRVRSEVVAATKTKQVPWSNSSLLGEVFLAGGR